MTVEKTPLTIGLHAARANLVPGLILQGVMLGILLAYYYFPPAARCLQVLAEMKRNGGLLFIVVTSLIAGSLLPIALKIAIEQRGRWRRGNLEELLFLAGFWVLNGIAVDLFYRGQAWWFGPQVDFPTVAKKVLVDEFFYSPFFATPFGMFCYEWRHQGYSTRGLSRTLTWTFYKNRSFPALIASWGVWFPLVTAIYSLPPLLQFPIFLLALTFWVLMFSFINVKAHAAHAAQPPVELVKALD